jgi:hypothetical protein
MSVNKIKKTSIRIRLFSALYLLSFAMLAGWFVLLLVGFVKPQVMTFANRIALPMLAGSVVCVELFRWLARREERRK